MINQNKNTVSQVFSFNNDTFLTVKKYVTSDNRNTRDEGTLTCVGNSFTDNFYAQSITTCVSNKIPTGFSFVKSPEILIFPYPASDILQLSSVENVTSYRVFNLLGQPLIVQSNPHSSSINIFNLYSGIYLVKIRQKEEAKIIRFVKK